MDKQYSLVQVAACDGSPARDLDVVHVANQRGRGIGVVVKGVWRRGVSCRLVDTSREFAAQSYLQQTFASTVSAPHVPAPAVGWA